MAGQGSDPAGPEGAWATQDINQVIGATPDNPGAGAGEAVDPETVLANPVYPYPGSSTPETGPDAYPAAGYPAAGYQAPGYQPPGTPSSGFPTSPDAEAARRNRRRRRRQSITFGVFFLVVVGIGLLMLAAYKGRVTLPISDGKPSPLPTCGPAPSPTLQAFSDTSVHVLNASSRKGLALSVARDLQRRGFKVPTTPSNDPQKTKMTTLAVIRYGPKGDLAAHTLATVVAGPVTYQVDDRLGTDVDLVLGQTFALISGPSGTATAQSPGAATAGAVPGAAASASPTCEPASIP